MKVVTYEDIYRSLDLDEAESILFDAFAEEEALKHLQARYGEIEDLFFINYEPK